MYVGSKSLMTGLGRHSTLDCIFKIEVEVILKSGPLKVFDFTNGKNVMIIRNAIKDIMQDRMIMFVIMIMIMIMFNLTLTT